ncbi:hypothetical protein NE237_001236 [Protea cynaroides]|uniref:Bidirectional sugar transporter SWEET n=1 Tax=Protea cynaroides TaxID=273540 RepID=A0A9Q0KSY1_9MAGN|nr:hypothetical protein NE237_001236 [Protea cynaroides]
MEDKLHLAFGIAGNVTSVLLYAAPIFTFKRVIRKRSTEEFSSVPYVFTLLTVLLYFWYGLPVVSYKWENITLVTICGVGILLQSSFILIYFWFTSARGKRMVTLMVVAVIVVVSITVLVSTFVLHDRHHRKLFVGSISLVFSIGMYGAPLVVVKQVVQTKSVEYMPFNLSLFSFLNSSMWGPYGLLGHDPFIAIPNLLGWPLSLFQLVLYFIYRKRDIHKEPNDDQADLEKTPKKLNSSLARR